MRILIAPAMFCLFAVPISAGEISILNLTSLLEQTDNTVTALTQFGLLPNSDLSLSGSYTDAGWSATLTGSTSDGSFSSSYSGVTSGSLGSELTDSFSGSGMIGASTFSSSGEIQFLYNSTLADYDTLLYSESGSYSDPSDPNWGTAAAEVLIGGGIGAGGFFFSGPLGFATTIAGAGVGLAFSQVVLTPTPTPPATPPVPPPPPSVPVPPPTQNGFENLIINGNNNTIIKNLNGNTINGSFNPTIGSVSGTVAAMATPEPSTTILFALGLGCCAAARLRRRG